MRCIGLLLVAGLLACSADPPPAPISPTDVPAAPERSADTLDSDSAPTCAAPEMWAPGRPAFVEAGPEWGLSGVRGVRMGVLDIDSDGYPDLLVRIGGGPDEFGTPDGQRSRFLLRNTGAGAFEDVTQSSGLLRGRLNAAPEFGRPGDVPVAGDVNNDGHTDVWFGLTAKPSQQPQETSELMLGVGDGTFVLGPEDSPIRLVQQTAVPAGAAFVDVDLDGDLDLWLTQNMAGGAPWPLQDRLFLGDGSGGFSEVTEAAGLTSRPWSVPVTWLNEARGHSWAWSAAACDLNNDGLPELLAASYGRAPNHLWRQVAGGDVDTPQFMNESVGSGYAFDHRFDWADNGSARCHCRDFPDDADCAGVPEPTVDCAQLKAAFGGNYRWNHVLDREAWRLGGNSGATICADVNNDGWLDLVTNEIVHGDVGASSDPSELLLNLKDPDVRFSRPGAEALGLTREDVLENWDRGDMSGAVFDFDNDGRPDIYVGASDYHGNKALLFRQTEQWGFQRVAFTDFFEHNRAHGVAVADFDRDGDLDVVAGHSRFRCDGAQGSDCYESEQVRLFLNQAADNGAHWLQLRLTGGDTSNRAAIGARVQVTANGMTQTRIVDGGHGHFGTQRDLTLHFGLGPACEAEVEITWPNKARTTQLLTLAADQAYRVTQSEDARSLP